MTVHQRTQRGDMFAGYTDLEVTICTCGVLFAAPAKLLDTRRWDGQGFYCPNGHGLSFDGDRNRQERELKETRERAGRLAHQRDQAEASLRAQRGATTRARRERDRIAGRIRNGVCPCCNRSFKDVHRHMKSQHPEFNPAVDDE